MVMIMKSMELDDEEKIDAPMPIPTEKPDYPWGLRISLTQAELDKLNLDPDDAVVGGIFHLFGMARITYVSQSEDENGSCCRIEAQIESLGVESEDEENETMDAAEKNE